MLKNIFSIKLSLAIFYTPKNQQKQNGLFYLYNICFELFIETINANVFLSSVMILSLIFYFFKDFTKKQ